MIELVNQEECVNTTTITNDEYKALVKAEDKLETVARYVLAHDYLDKKELMILMGIDKEVECEPLKARKK